ncbi:ArsR/SmtB family transcription factor [Thermomonospora umbrina]|uniref:ArsR family transcriptional regulator n=1 Tax=Thermomonospora umbrina TaxID=111806 RepID=A0A3D9SX29_9ACTN|nr:metalloregulator ArsR/SmtB family transcription factor [Thermomonospora umbrina]REF00510.1 ArsR family transcriptional regulator [Thermomonospora umbrina]
MEERARKSALYEQFAQVGKALGNPARLELLELLAQGERSVEELSAASGMKLSNTSAQLRALAQAGLVTTRRDGVRVYYRPAGDDVTALIEHVQTFAVRRLAEAERAAHAYLGDLTALEPVGLDELARRSEAGEVVVLDVRPASEFEAGHIPGAIGIPHDQIASRLAELPSDAEIVAYCRGRYCVFAPQAVRVLHEHGFTARIADGGVPEWRRTGRPLATAR